MTAIREIDPAGDFLVCEAGCVLEDVQNAADEVGRLFPLSLGAQGSCRIGGNISTNAGGVNVLRYGMMRDLVLGLEVVLPDGRIWNGLRSLKKDNTGYDLKQLFIGGEGTLGIVTAASLKLVARPAEKVTLWLGVASPAVAVELYTLFRTRLGELISSFELIAGLGVDAAVEHLPGVRAPIEGSHDWHLLIELAWSFDEGLLERAEAVIEEAFEREMIADGTIAQSGDQAANMWRIREGQSEATRNIGNIVRSDVSVRTSDIPDLVDAVDRFVRSEAGDVRILPFGHVGDGNLHFNFLLPFDNDSPERHKLLLNRLYDELDRRGGSISAEHGIGRMKQAAMMSRKSEVELDLMRRLKAAIDPDNIMNPGVILPAD
jgi:FAD/FMN-containing dehydrogenase